MNKYLALYEAIELPSFAIELAGGTHESAWFEPVRLRSFPPAFLPLFVHWNNDYGYWKHWFTPERQLTLVEHHGVASIERTLSIAEMISSPDSSRRNELVVTEVACDLNQLVRIQLHDWLCQEDDWNDDLRSFASRAGILEGDIEYIDKVSAYPPAASFRDHPLFLERPPLSLFENDLTGYTGDFPHPEMEFTAERLSQLCGYEIHSSYMYEEMGGAGTDLRDLLGELDIAPNWLKTHDQKLVFDQMIKEGNLSGAWMSLNSFSWVASDAVQALERLGNAAKDKHFDMLVDAYSSLDHRENDGY